MSEQDLKDILDGNLKDIRALGFGDSEKAELLYHRTKMPSEKFFGLKYSADLVGLKFRVQFTMIENLQAIWDQNVSKLYAISKAMYDDYSLDFLKKSHRPEPLTNPEVKYVKVEDTEKIDALNLKVSQLQSKLDSIEIAKRRIKKNIVFWFLLVILSVLLWTFDSIVKWQWLLDHPKKIAIYIALQLLIILLLVRIIAKNKAIDIATIVAIIAALISII